jgi:hypothetical protein
VSKIPPGSGFRESTGKKTAARNFRISILDLLRQAENRDKEISV